MTNVVDLGSYRRKDPWILGEPETLYEGDLQIYIPTPSPIEEAWVPWTDQPMKASRFYHLIGSGPGDEGNVPFYYVGPKDILWRNVGRMIMCHTQIVSCRYRDGSRVVAMLVAPRPKLRLADHPVLMIFGNHLSTLPGYRIIETFALPADLYSKILIVESTDSPGK